MDYIQYLNPTEEFIVDVKTLISWFNLNFFRFFKGTNKAYELQHKNNKIHLSFPKDLDIVLSKHIENYTSLNDELGKSSKEIKNSFYDNNLCENLIKGYFNNHHAAEILYERFKKIC